MPKRATRTGPKRSTPSSEGEHGQGALLSVICHDLRAPLAAVTMGTNFVLQTMDRDEASAESAARSRKILQAMLRSCGTMEQLIRNFGDLASLESGSVELRLEAQDARALLEAARESARAGAKARGVELAIEAPPEGLAPTLACDRERVLRALGHLIDNAVKASPSGSTVTLAIERDDDGEISFLVRDQGTGPTGEVLRHLFDRAWHAKRSGRSGSGFGLSIARGFARAHGGDVTLDPRGDGERAAGATTFRLVLPESPEATRARRASTVTETATTAGRRRRSAARGGAPA